MCESKKTALNRGVFLGFPSVRGLASFLNALGIANVLKVDRGEIITKTRNPVLKGEANRRKRKRPQAVAAVKRIDKLRKIANNSLNEKVPECRRSE